MTSMKTGPFHHCWTDRSRRDVAGLSTALASSLLTIVSLAPAGAAEFHLKNGEMLQGEVISANANALAIAPERAALNLRLVPRSNITKVMVETEGSGSVEGRLHSWEDGVYAVARGQDLVRIRAGRVVAVTPIAAAGTSSLDPSDVDDDKMISRPAERHIDHLAEPKSGVDAASPRLGLTIDVSAAAVIEGDSALLIEVTLSRSAEESIVLVFSTLDGTAVAGQDYVQDAGVITLSAGQTVVEQEIMLIDDDLVEGEETFELFLSVDPGVAELRKSYVTATIRDND